MSIGRPDSGVIEHKFKIGQLVYFYPKGEHMLDTPWERVASLQRNVDWFRFWMQGFERAHPEDHEQYIRWEALRRLHSEDVKKLDGDKTKSGGSNF